MVQDDRLKPRFEPPPWEIEAFERFRREQEQACAAEELDRALETVRHTEEAPEAATELAEQPIGNTPGPQAVEPRPGLVPEGRIEEMLAELRIEETPPTGASLTLIYSVAALLGTMGVFIVIGGLMLFAKAEPTEGSATMIAAMISIVMLLTGGGGIAAAVALYRKSQQ